jgi:hypothetical protein
MARKVDDGFYVQGYNHSAFESVRHDDAQAGKPMKREHDVHSLVVLSKRYFCWGTGYTDPTSLEDLIRIFEDESTTVQQQINVSPLPDEQHATGSAAEKPVQQETDNLEIAERMQELEAEIKARQAQLDEMTKAVAPAVDGKQRTRSAAGKWTTSTA